MAIKERDLAELMSHAAPETPSPLDALIDKPVASASVMQPGMLLGVCKQLDEQGQVKVAFPGSSGEVIAKLAIALRAERVRRAIDIQQQVVLMLENGDASRPIIMGLIESSVSQTSPNEETGAAQVIECDVDGKRVRVVGQDEIVLQCGAASITLRRNGRVLIRGTHVETYSEGTNRIKGGQVRIN